MFETDSGVLVAFDRLITDNDKLNKTVRQFQAPTVTRFIIDSDGYGTAPPTHTSALISLHSFFCSAELNVMEIRPPNMDDSGRQRYPVLFRVFVPLPHFLAPQSPTKARWFWHYRYGGPGSQMVHNKFDKDWHHYLSCSLKYIIVIVDGRGTGFKGRKLRNPVRGNLGYHEVIDQVNAARYDISQAHSLGLLDG